MKERIKQIIKTQLKFEVVDLKDNDHIKETLGLDSIDFLSFMIGIEKEFNISILDNEVNKETFYSLNTLESFVQSKGGK